MQFSATTSFNFNRSHDFFILNNQNGYQESNVTGASEKFSMNWKDLVEIDPEYSYNSKNYIRHNVYTMYNFFCPKHMNLEGTYTYLYNPLVPAGFKKISACLTLAWPGVFSIRIGQKLSCSVMIC